MTVAGSSEDAAPAGQEQAAAGIVHGGLVCFPIQPNHTGFLSTSDRGWEAEQCRFGRLHAQIIDD